MKRQFPFSGQERPVLAVVQPENGPLGLRQRLFFLLRLLDGLDKPVVQVLVEHELADPVQNAGHEALLRQRILDPRADHVGDHARADRMLPELDQVEFLFLPALQAEEPDDRSRQRQAFDGVEPEDHDALAHGRDLPGESVVGGIDDLEDAGGQRLVQADLAGQLLHVALRILHDFENPRNHRGERRDFFYALNDLRDRLRRSAAGPFGCRCRISHRPVTLY